MLDDMTFRNMSPNPMKVYSARGSRIQRFPSSIAGQARHRGRAW
jgi:hypothetical protein